jgi:hypothetical protein
MAGKIGSKLVTEPQMHLLERLAKQNGFADVEDALHANNIDIRLRNWKYELQSVDASLTIDALKSGKLTYEAPPPPEPVHEGAPTPIDILTLIGRTVQVLTASDNIYEGTVVGMTTKTTRGTLGVLIDSHPPVRFDAIKRISLLGGDSTATEVRAAADDERASLLAERTRLLERLAGIDALLGVQATS